MTIISRLICEKLSCIAVKISFLLGCEHCVHAEVSFAASVTSRYLRNDMQNFTSVILYVNIIYIAQYLSGTNFEILYCSGPIARRHKLFKTRNTSKQTRVEIFYRENMTSFLNYVTATLRALFAWRGSNGACNFILWRSLDRCHNYRLGCFGDFASLLCPWPDGSAGASSNRIVRLSVIPSRLQSAIFKVRMMIQSPNLDC